MMYSEVCGGEPEHPDMQSIKIRFPCEETSMCMAYRWRNVYFALALAGLLALRIKSESSESSSYQAVAALSAGLFSLAVLNLLYFRTPDKRPPQQWYMPNTVHLLADLFEIVYALYRLTAFVSGVDKIDESTLLWELLVQTLLPRPLFDYSNPSWSVVVAVLMSFAPDIWQITADVRIFALLLLFAVLPKLNWVVIYFTQRANAPTHGIILRDTYTALSVTLYLAGWVYFLTQLYQAYGDTVRSTAYTSRPALCSTLFVLLALAPLNKFQDLSMCVQMVLIEQHY